MKHVIITGATGMIGIALINRCIKHEIYVTAVVRPRSININRLPTSQYLSIVECDLSNYSLLQNLTHLQADVFFHLGWSNTDSNRDADMINQSKNIFYSLQAVSAAKALGCKVFIGAGSQAEYGILNKEPISGNTVPHPNTPYGICKHAAGQLVLLSCRQVGINGVWARIFSVYGIGDRNSSMINTAIEAFSNGRCLAFTKGTHLWDYLYSDDAAEALFLLAGKNVPSGEYCVASGFSQPLRKYVEEIRDVVNPSLELRFGDIPYPPQGVVSLQVDIKKLKDITGFFPKINFREGLERILKSKMIKD